MIKNISVEIIEYTAHALAIKTMSWNEPIPPFETRYPNVLESCVTTPFQKFDKKYLYHGLVSKAAILFYLIIKNHPFQNGNKRIAITVLLVFLYLNNKWLKADKTELYNFAIWVAQSPVEAKTDIMNYIEKFIRRRLTARLNKA
jgi:death-on-curing family protein